MQKLTEKVAEKKKENGSLKKQCKSLNEDIAKHKAEYAEFKELLIGLKDQHMKFKVKLKKNEKNLQKRIKKQKQMTDK